MKAKGRKPKRIKPKARKRKGRKTKGLKATNVPLLYKVNYPEHGQVGIFVKFNRQKQQVYEVFNFSRFKKKRSCRTAAERFAPKKNRKFPSLARQSMAELRRS